LADHRKKTEESADYTIQVSEEDSLFLKRYAAYRTALARLTGEKLPSEGRWSRKNLSESLLAAKCDELRDQLEEMFKACGPIPEPGADKESKAEMSRYAARVFAWAEQLERKK
jgi:hypothetical protein